MVLLMQELFKYIPQAATSPLALTAYLLAVASYTWIAHRVVRNKNLLAALDKLPEKDRRPTLEAEMGHIKTPKGMTPEQYIQLTIRRNIIAAAVIFGILITVVFTIAVFRKNAHVDVSITPSGTPSKVSDPSAQPQPLAMALGYKSGTKLQPDNGRVNHPYVVDYKYDVVNGSLKIYPDGDVYKVPLNGSFLKPDDRVLLAATAFDWSFPQLSVKTSNNSEETLLLTEAVLEVSSSSVDEEPIPIYHYCSEQVFNFENQGWGDMKDVVLNFNLTRTPDFTEEQNDNFDPCQYITDLPFHETFPHETRLPDIPAGGIASVYLPPFWPDGTKKYESSEIYPHNTVKDEESVWVMEQDGSVLQMSQKEYEDTDENSGKNSKQNFGLLDNLLMTGVISYKNGRNESRSFKFKSYIFPGGGASTEGLIKVTYDLRLEAGKSNVTYRVPIGQYTKPSDVDEFQLRIVSDKSAYYQGKITILAGSKPVATKNLDLRVFVPFAIREMTDEGKLYDYQQGKLQKSKAASTKPPKP